MSSRLRTRFLAVALAASLTMLAAPERSSAQFFGGYGGFGRYGGLGLGYGGLGFGYGGFGYPGLGFGYGGYGYPFGNFFGYAGYGMAGYYYPFWNNPATLSLGITPLAMQSALMQRGLRSAGGLSALSGSPRCVPLVLDAPGGTQAQGGSTVFSSPAQRLPAGTYRVQIIRVDPKHKNDGQDQPAPKP